MSKLAPFLLTILALCQPPAHAAQPHWAQFRGPNGSGVADDQNPPIHFGLRSNLLWSVNLPPGASSPCIWGDRIFLTAFDQEKLETICLDRSDGTILWRQTAPAESIEPFHAKEGSPAASTPVANAERVFVYFGSYGLLCYDFNGHEQWRMPLSVADTSGGFGSGVSPILADGLVILNRDLKRGSALYAVRARNGQLAWSLPRQDFLSSYSTPITWKTGEDEEIIVAGSLRLNSYSLKTGAELWSVEGLPTASCTTPVLGKGILYFAGWAPNTREMSIPAFQSQLERLDKDGDEIIKYEEADDQMRSFFASFDQDNDRQVTRAEWDNFLALLSKGKNSLLAIRPGGSGDVTQSHVAWTRTRGLPYVPSPLYYRDRIYLVKDGGLASCYDAVTGDTHYEQERLGALGAYYSSPVAADGRIYAISIRGMVTVFAAGDELKVLATSDLDQRVVTTPAIVDDKIYLRGEMALYAFGQR